MFASNTSQVSSDATYIEDVFSTYLYTGNGSTQTITNGIDLAGKGGLVWGKARSQAYNNRLFDTDRGGSNSLISNSTGATSSFSGFITSFNNDGFSIGTAADLNENGTTYTSWTFRKAPKFFDVVTYTGTGSPQTISHSLGSAPGCIIVKSTTNARNWAVYHASLGNGSAIYLNSTAAAFANDPIYWNNTSPTSTGFSVNTWVQNNEAGQTYVAYIFAHNAGGFGLTGTDNVISCGSFTTDASGIASVNLGYEPQWVLLKQTTAAQNWLLLDNMRGFTTEGQSDKWLVPNSSAAESTGAIASPTATGFTTEGTSTSATYIYIAIRRGPMKTPTSGTSVYTTDTTSGSTFPAFSSNFPVDLGIVTATTGAGKQFQSRLMGTYYVDSTSTAAEVSSSIVGQFDSNVGFCGGIGAGYMSWMFRRAPGFFDVVCYRGTGSTGNLQSHNLSVVPELIIFKNRSSTGPWTVTYDMTSTTYWGIELNTTGSGFGPNTYATTSQFLYAAPTATNISVGNVTAVNASGNNFVAYLFASCPGVSKVGSYTGNGSSQTINCGFTGGARFVLIKRTDSTGDWYVWDTARGIVSANDPRLSLNTTAAEVTTDDSIDPNSSGFIVNQLTATNINVSSATYIYLAIA